MNALDFMPILFLYLDLFDAGLFRRPDTTEIFYTLMAELWEATVQAEHTHTHAFLQKLWENGRLLKCFTQNIDGLEERVGMRVGMDKVSQCVAHFLF